MTALAGQPRDDRRWARVAAICGFLTVLLVILAMAAVSRGDEPTPAPTPSIHVTAEALTGYVATAGASKPYVGLRVVAARETASGGQALRIEGQPHEGVTDATSVKSWVSADVIATVHRYISGDIGLVGVAGSSIPLEGGIPQAASRYPILAGGLVQWRPRDGAFRVAAGVGACGEAGPGVHALFSGRASGPGIGAAGSALVVDGCYGKTSLVRASVAVGVR